MLHVTCHRVLKGVKSVISQWSRTDLLDLHDFTRQEIEIVLETARSFKEVSQRDVKKVPALRGKTVVMLFFEPSTRTRTSFELAAKRLSADTLNISMNASSLSKGETILDTAKNIEAMSVDAIIVRHSCAGVPHVLSRNLEPSIINAGDGCRAHPTQALLDMFTIRERLGQIEGLKVGIIGDIRHSRVARCNIWGLTKMGAEVTVCGPSTLIPPGVEKLGARVSYDMEHIIKNSDVLMLLRLQKERQKDKYIPSLREYARVFGIDGEKLRKAKKDVLIMHPGPTNRGVEITAEVADGNRSVILEQVTNGVAIRMAILYLVLGARETLKKQKEKF